MRSGQLSVSLPTHRGSSSPSVFDLDGDLSRPRLGKGYIDDLDNIDISLLLNLGSADGGRKLLG